MRKFLIAAHGSFSSGIKSSLDIIIGKVENVHIIDAYVDGNTLVEEDIKTILAGIQPQDELIVFSDLMGGSITNQVLRGGLKNNVHIVAGVNLPLLIEIMLADDDSPIDSLIENAIVLAKDQMVYVNKVLGKENRND